MNSLWQDVLGVIAVIGLVALNAFFVAAEYALITVSGRRARTEVLAEEGNRAARRVLKALAHLDTCIAGTQVGITMAALGLGSVGETALARLLMSPFSGILPAGRSALTVHAVSLTLAFLLVTVLEIVLGELVPKSIAIQRADGLLLRIIAPLSLFLGVFRPFIAALNATGNGVLRLIGIMPVGTYSVAHSVEELEVLLHKTREAGLLEAQQEEMVSGIFDFPDTVVRKIMTPRLDITAVDACARTSDLIHVIAESGHSRLPVYDGELDNIIGLIHAKDILTTLADGSSPRAVRDLMRPAYFIPETKKVDDLLAEMRRRKLQMAIVRDEYGTVTGVVTLEDLVEEIIGEIQDEYDFEEPMIRNLDDHTFVVDGKMSVGDVNERLELDLSEEDADTIGGLLFNLLGHQGQSGERVQLAAVTLSVESTDGRRIIKVRVERMPSPEDPDDLSPSSEQ